MKKISFRRTKQKFRLFAIKHSKLTLGSVIVFGLLAGYIPTVLLSANTSTPIVSVEKTGKPIPQSASVPEKPTSLPNEEAAVTSPVTPAPATTPQVTSQPTTPPTRPQQSISTTEAPFIRVGVLVLTDSSSYGACKFTTAVRLHGLNSTGSVEEVVTTDDPRQGPFTKITPLNFGDSRSSYEYANTVEFNNEGYPYNMVHIIVTLKVKNAQGSVLNEQTKNEDCL